MPDSSTSKVAKDDFHLARSHFLDAFAALEEALHRLPQATRDKRLADQIKELRTIRNDLVHSQLQFGQLQGELQAVIVNAQTPNGPARQCRLIKFEDFGHLARQLDDATRKIAKS